MMTLRPIENCIARINDLTAEQCDAALQLADEKVYETAKALDDYSDMKSLLIAVARRDGRFANVIAFGNW